MAEATRVNLAALQQRDPYITEITDKALIVALYKFSTEMRKWSLTGIEGSLFVYKRSATPYYGLMVLNRKDLNNLFQPLTPNVEFHLETPFLMYKKAVDDPEDAIWGIWFEDRTECLRLTETIQRVLKEVVGQESESMSESDSGYFGRLGGGAVTGVPGGPVAVNKPPTQGMNILSLLSNARNKYEQEHGASQDQGTEPKPIHHASAGDASGMSQISLDELFRTVNKHQAKAGLRDSSTATSSNPHLPKNPPLSRSLSVSEVEAQSQSHEPKKVAPVPGPAPTQDDRHPLLRLISSKTVEEIERQHMEDYKRAKENIHGSQVSLPPEAKPASGKSRSPGGATDSATVDLLSLLGQGESSNRTFVPVSNAAPSVGDLEHSLSSMTLPVMPDAPLAETIHGSGDRDRKESLSGISSLPTPGFLKPSDLDPSLAAPKSSSRNLSSNGRNKSPTNVPFLTPQAFADISYVKPSQIRQSPSTKLLLPASLPTSSTSATSNVDLAPLTKEQLQQALIHMIKSDTDFVNRLHTAYLDSFQTSTGKKT